MDSKVHSDSMTAASYPQVHDTTGPFQEHERPVRYRSPKTRWGALLLLVRADSAAALAIPALLGTVAAWWATDTFYWFGFILSTLALLCLTLGLNTLSEYSDYRFGLRPESKYLHDEPTFAGENLIAYGLFQPSSVIRIGCTFMAVALLCVAVLTWLSTGWPTLFFFGLTGVCLATYLLPPRWHGYLSVGIGELSIFLGCGVVQVVNSYYVQIQSINLPVFLLGVPLGLMCALVLFCRSLVRQRRNWMIRKRTLAVALGERHSVYFCIVIIVAAYVSLLLVVILTPLPVLLLFCLATLPIALGQFKDTDVVVRSPDTWMYVYRIMVKVTIYTGILMMLMLILDKPG